MTSGEGRETGDERVAGGVTGSERGRSGARRRGGGECERAVVERASAQPSGDGDGGSERARGSVPGPS